MIISEEYGPQFDPSDGTVGAIRLVRRWLLAHPDGRMWGAQQGRYTYSTKEEAEHMLAAVVNNNRPELYPKGLMVADYWCWPGHFDPVGPVPLPGQAKEVWQIGT